MASVEDRVVAVGALLLDAAAIDGDVDDAEVAVAVRRLAERFDLDAGRAEDLLERSRERIEEAEGFARLVDPVAAELSVDERVDLLALVWEVLLADRQVDRFEAMLAGRLARHLALDPDQASEALDRAKRPRVTSGR